MGKDYYAILNLNRDASAAEIARSFRWLATKWHPDRNQSEKTKALFRFSEIAEAYEVLSDLKKRAVFDQYGEEGLKAGVIGPSGRLLGGWQFSSDPQNVFSKFFGKTSPFGDSVLLQDDDVSPWRFDNPGSDRTVPPIQLPLNISLEEAFTGCFKKVTFTRKRLLPDRRCTTDEERTLTVAVEPGWGEGTVVKFPSEGHELLHYIPPGALEVLIKENPHPVLSREGTNLVYVNKVPLANALDGHVCRVPRLDGTVLSLALPAVSRGSDSCIFTQKGEGMPVAGRPGERGDLIIKTAVEYPAKLSGKARSTIRKALAEPVRAK